MIGFTLQDHCNALISGHPGGGYPRELPRDCTTTFTNRPYPKPRLFTKSYQCPSPGGKVVCSASQKVQYFKRVLQKESQFSSKKYTCYVSKGWPVTRSRIKQKYESCLPSFLSPFCQNVSTNIPSPFADGNGTRFKLHLQNGGGATNPTGLHPKIPLRKSKSNPIPLSRA